MFPPPPPARGKASLPASCLAVARLPGGRPRPLSSCPTRGLWEPGGQVEDNWAGMRAAIWGGEVKPSQEEILFHTTSSLPGGSLGCSRRIPAEVPETVGYLAVNGKTKELEGQLEDIQINPLLSDRTQVKAAWHISGCWFSCQTFFSPSFLPSLPSGGFSSPAGGGGRVSVWAEGFEGGCFSPALRTPCSSSLSTPGIWLLVQVHLWHFPLDFAG